MKNFALVCVLFFLGPSVIAEITVALTPPEFISGGDLLAESFTQASDVLTDRVNRLLDDEWMQKPLFMKGFGNAASYALLVSHSVPSTSLPSVNFGLVASVWVDPLDRETVKMIRRIDLNSDAPMGASARPFVVAFEFPLDSWKPGLSAGGTFGYMDLTEGDYRARSFSAGLGAGYRLRGSRFGVVTWNGFAFHAGVDFSVDDVSALYEFYEISETISLDTDGIGTVPSFNANLSITPAIEAGGKVSALVFGFRLSTGITFIEAVSAFGGIGITASSSISRIWVSLDEEITLDEYTASLVDKPGRVTVSGDLERERSGGVGGYFEGGLQFHAGALLITLPVLWTPYYAFGTGVFLGVSF